MRALAFLLAVPLAASAADTEHPYKNAKVGDVFAYKMMAQLPLAKGKTPAAGATSTQTVTEKSDKELTLKSVSSFQGKESTHTIKIDLTKPFNVPVSVTGPGPAKCEKVKDGTDKLKVGEKEYDCTWTTYKMETGKLPPDAPAIDQECKVWLCKEVPGVVKWTLTMKIAGREPMVVGSEELTKFESKK